MAFSTSSTKPKLVFFLPSVVAGGAELHAVTLCEQMIEAGFDCTIMVHGPQSSDALLGRNVVRNAVRLNLRGMSEVRGWIDIWREFRRLRPDVVVAVNQTPLIVSVIEKALSGARAALACIFHSTDLQPFERHLETPFRICASRTDLLVYVGESQRKVWEGRGVVARRVRVIQNGVDLSRFRPSANCRQEARASLGLNGDVFLLGIVAAFRREKNHTELIEALAQARRMGSRAMILAVGEGATLGESKALAKELGIADRIIFAGESREVDRLVNACDAGVLCSVTESFPMAVMEFLASGAPMLVSAVSGNLELVTPHYNGLSHRPGDVAGFAANILALEDRDTRARLAANARPSVERFSQESMAAAYRDEFERLCVRNHV